MTKTDSLFHCLGDSHLRDGMEWNEELSNVFGIEAPPATDALEFGPRAD